MRDAIPTIDALDDLLSEPPVPVVESLGRIEGDILVLGVAGKMGPSLARMAKRASEEAGVRRRVIGVARFGAPEDEGRFQEFGVETIRCDLLQPGALEALPDAPNVVFLAGRKFGSTGDEPRTWAVNALLPGLVARRFRASRIVALSTGNVYGLIPQGRGGSREDDPLDPRGEYAMSCVGRERILSFSSATLGTPMAILRLNYAVEMRYGVLVDLARRILDGLPIDLTTGHFNAIWQGDAAAIALRALEHVAKPPLVLNVTGPEVLSVRDVADRLGVLLGRQVAFEGMESGEALLSDSGRCRELFGPPLVPLDRVLRWTADWLLRGGPTFDKPTHFEVRDGRF
ncbi:MAG TPA: NAD(P)-dependent oxidoreductase [Isosphaeraceae bacterium]|jgi:nucleoside-diphosphate-sugar epimerase|nr:NAD(P)-dependent oxidoreductase [Isosphaeraceae bacterium]